MSRYFKIEDICKVQGGKRIPQGETLQEEKNTHPYIRILDMYQGRILNLNEHMLYAREKYWDKIKSYIVDEGDVILAIVGNTLGMVSIIGKTLDKANLTENCCKFSDVDTEKVLPLFLYYSLKAPLNQKQIEVFRVGSSQPKLPIYNINQLLIPKYSLNMQKKIIDTLSAIDSKIENNNKINGELESMAKTIYDYWFLQFDFPDENGKPYKSSGGKMVWNKELRREIPEGWEVKKLMNLCSFNNGINYEKGVIGDKEYKIINVRNITTSSMLLDSSDFDKISLLSSQAEKYIVKPDDILIARSGTPGATRLLFSNDENIIYCGFIINCVPNKKMQRLFLAYALKKLEGSNVTKTGGSIMQNVSQETLKQVNICLPSDELIDKYNSIINPLIYKMQEIIWENQELISLRDFLLPLLMNGQIGFK